MVTIDDIKPVKDFLDKRGIKFVLTGTAALYIYGLIPDNYEVGDIDIIVVASKSSESRIYSILDDLEKLTGSQNISKEGYEHKCFTFIAGPNKVKVNAIIYNIEENEDLNYIELAFNNNTLKLHTADDILKAKFKLGRLKDFKFYNNLLTTLCAYFKK